MQLDILTEKIALKIKDLKYGETETDLYSCVPKFHFSLTSVLCCIYSLVENPMMKNNFPHVTMSLSLVPGNS